MGIALSILNTLGNEINVEDVDFAQLHVLTKRRFANNYHGELVIRKNNLSLIAKELDSASIQYWIIGKTLLGLSNFSNFIPDHDDDIGIDFSRLIPFCKNVIPVLLGQGFRLIRVDPNDQMISLYRDGRYIDICIFTRKGCNGYGYGGKVYPHQYFQSTVNYNLVGGERLKVPSGYLELCSLKYPYLVNYLLSSFLIWEHGISYINSILEILKKEPKLRPALTVRFFELSSSFLEEFAYLIYCKEMVPGDIIAKTNFLRSMRKDDTGSYKIAVLKMKSNFSEDDGFMLNEALMARHEAKWRIRERFNPRSINNPTLKLPFTSMGVTHNHVIHGCDKISELIYLDELTGRHGCEFFLK